MQAHAHVELFNRVLALQMNLMVMRKMQAYVYMGVGVGVGCVVGVVVLTSCPYSLLTSFLYPPLPLSVPLPVLVVPSVGGFQLLRIFFQGGFQLLRILFQRCLRRCQL